MNNQQLAVVGSVADAAHRRETRLANAAMDVQHVVLIDCSGSMESIDADGGERSRYDAACRELRRLQQYNRGKFAVFAFSNDVEFCPGGLPRLIGGSTNLTRALEYIFDLDGTGVTFNVISDGCPDNEVSALAVACRMTTKINTIYVGPAFSDLDYTMREIERAMAFMRQLADLSGGKSAVGDAGAIGTTIAGLLTTKGANV
jgi:hypothetical protein